MIYVSRQEHFNAAHKLYNEEWSLQRNQEVFGPCANENWHGHNYNLIVTVKGEPDPQTGFVVDLKRLSVLIKQAVLEPLDHKNLNLDVPFMKDVLPSCENLIYQFWKLLEPEIKVIAPDAKLHSLKLYETPKNFVEYFGE